MIPVMQTKPTNCLEACIASLLEVRIEDIPDLEAYTDGPWMKKLNEWLEINYQVVYMEVQILSKEVSKFFQDKDFFHIIIGKTLRSSKIRHAIIARQGKMLHDPYPGGLGVLDDEFLMIGILVKGAKRGR